MGHLIIKKNNRGIATALCLSWQMLTQTGLCPVKKHRLSAKVCDPEVPVVTCMETNPQHFAPFLQKKFGVSDDGGESLARGMGAA